MRRTDLVARAAASLVAAASLAACASAPAMAASASSSSAAVRIAGTWTLADPYQAAIKTVEGRDPPLRPEARQLLQKRISDRRAGNADDGVDQCLRPGTPRIMWQPRPFVILATPKKITFVHEYQHVLRHVYLNEPLPPADEMEVLYGGTSIGRWDGDTLVVETAGFNDQTRLDEAGLPHSPEMKVTESFRLIDANTLEDRVTINDPKTYTAPWTTRILFKRAPAGTQLQEHICAEKLLDPQLRANIVKEVSR